MNARSASLLVGAVVAFAAMPALAYAQMSNSGNPVSDALRSDLTRSQRNLVGAAQEMPADKYGFSPTGKEMSFGQLVLHIAGSNDYMCSTISGMSRPNPAKMQPTAPKDSLLARLKSSFEYCSSALKNVSDADLGAQVPFFGGRKVTKATAMMGLAEDWSDHYAQAAIYLRLNGHLPPTAQHGEM